MAALAEAPDGYASPQKPPRRTRQLEAPPPKASETGKVEPEQARSAQPKRIELPAEGRPVRGAPAHLAGTREPARAAEKRERRIRAEARSPIRQYAKSRSSTG